MFYCSGVETLVTSCSRYTARDMTVSQPQRTVAIHDLNGLFFEGSRTLDFTCCDVDPAILGTSSADSLRGNFVGVLTFQLSEERTPPHDDLRQPIVCRYHGQSVEHILPLLSG